MNEWVEVLGEVKKLHFRGRRLFFRTLQAIATDKSTLEDKNENLVAWPDALLFIEHDDMAEAWRITVDGMQQINDAIKADKNDRDKESEKKGGESDVHN